MLFRSDAVGRYIEFCKASVPRDFYLRGLKVVLDCAHGATYHVAPLLFRELGAANLVAALGAKIGFPMMVKPARSGSALGSTKVEDAAGLPSAGLFASCRHVPTPFYRHP